jgi:NitT/TauT family transport system permease protein
MSATQAAKVREARRVTRGRSDWAELPARPARPRAPGWLAPQRAISPRTRWVLRGVSLLAPLTAWLALSTSGAVDPKFLPTPAATFSALTEMASSGELLTDTLASVERVLLGFGIALAVSVAAGFAMGTGRWPCSSR